jgi:hypothetical protein
MFIACSFPYSHCFDFGGHFVVAVVSLHASLGKGAKCFSAQRDTLGIFQPWIGED